MNYPDNPNYNLMCYVCLHRMIVHGATDILVLYEDSFPKIAQRFAKLPNVNLEIRKGITYKGPGSDHFNIRFKLPNLASLDFEYIFIDSDMYVIADLDQLWKLRHDKPWIGINHQRIPQWPDTHRKPFLNSGLQIVSDPKFYDHAAITACHRKAGNQYAVPGRDQALLFRYFKSIGYDYTHAQVGPEWNSCALVGRLTKKEKWVGRTTGLAQNHPIYINHYWCSNKPWQIKCPLHKAYKDKKVL